jgi:hypothetical protein
VRIYLAVLTTGLRLICTEEGEIQMFHTVLSITTALSVESEYDIEVRIYLAV